MGAFPNLFIDENSKLSVVLVKQFLFFNVLFQLNGWLCGTYASRVLLVQRCNASVPSTRLPRSPV